MTPTCTCKNPYPQSQVGLLQVRVRVGGVRQVGVRQVGSRLCVYVGDLRVIL